MMCFRLLVAIFVLALSTAAHAELKPVTDLSELERVLGSRKSSSGLAKAFMPMPEFGIKTGDDIRTDVETRRPTLGTFVTVVQITAHGKTNGMMVEVVNNDSEAKAVRAWMFFGNGSRASGTVLSNGDDHIVFKYAGTDAAGRARSFERHHVRIDDNTNTVQFKNMKMGDRSMPDSPVQTMKRQK